MKTNLSLSKTSEDPEHCLYEAISVIRSAEEARKFMQDLCTPAEIQAMAGRWKVVDLIKAEMPYRQIYDETGVSVTTVGRVARHLQLGAGGYHIIYERLKKKYHANKSTAKNSHSKKREVK